MKTQKRCLRPHMYTFIYLHKIIHQYQDNGIKLMTKNRDPKLFLV